MTPEEKLDKMCRDFSALGGDKQDYVLGILQALAFAKDEMGTDRPVEADKIRLKELRYEKQAVFCGNTRLCAGIRGHSFWM
jgi:hypothetical protein